jgi:AAA ATPase domain
MTFSRFERPKPLAGRGAQGARLDRLLSDARAGQSAVLVLRGEPGIGKTALLSYAAEGAGGFQVAWAAGVESEMELPFAGLHQLCGPMLGSLGRLPPPQRDALGTAFGLTRGARPDRFLVGLAVLSLLSDTAEERPLLCLIDDAQWLDRSSAQVLAFVARRLQAESVVLLFAEREPGELDQLAGLRALRPVSNRLPVRPLGRRDAPAQLSDFVFGNVDAERADHAALGHCAGFCGSRACASGARVRKGGYGHVRLLALRLQAPANRCSAALSWQLWSRSRRPVGPGHTLAGTLVPDRVRARPGDLPGFSLVRRGG